MKHSEQRRTQRENGDSNIGVYREVETVAVAVEGDGDGTAALATARATAGSYLFVFFNVYNFNALFSALR